MVDELKTILYKSFKTSDGYTIWSYEFEINEGDNIWQN